MFTGIIAGLGTIKQRKASGQGVLLTVEPDFVLDDPQEGESIAVNGVCLTATTITPHAFTMDVSPETLSRSTLGSLQIGSRVNLERALRLGDRLGGHLVSGHVDGIGDLVERRPLTQFTLFTIRLPQGLERYVIVKGSVAVDGISLTVNSCEGDRFSVAIIPHTANLTTMGFRQAGDRVNIEVDLIGKYIEKLVSAGRTKSGEHGPIDQGFLARHGFL